jgi:hypothetical protein
LHEFLGCNATKWGDGLVLVEEKVKLLFSVRLVFLPLRDIDFPVA